MRNGDEAAQPGPDSAFRNPHSALEKAMLSTNIRACLRLTRAWMLGIVRDRGTIFWMFAFPVLFVVVLGLAFGRSDVGSYDIGVAVDESTPTGRELLAALRAVKPFTVTSGSLDGELDALRRGRRSAVVSTQPAAAASATPASAETVVVYFDPSRGSSAQIVLPIIRQVVNDVDRERSGRPQTLTVEPRGLQSQSLDFIDYFLPGIIAFSIMQAGMFSAIPLVQLRVSRALKRFGATPIARWTVLASQGVTRLVLAAAQTLVLLLVGRLLFGIHISSSWPAMLAFMALGGAAFLGLGFAVSGLARTEEAVPALVQMVSFPMMFLSGVFWPIDNFPGPLRAFARVLPLTFLGDGLRQVMVGGTPINPLWLDFVVLLGWVVAGGVLAVRVFKWE
jgi:ABC-2 type transport system permease protein